MKILVDLGEGFEAEMLAFFAEFGVSPTNQQVGSFIEACAMQGINTMIQSHVFAHSIMHNDTIPRSVASKIPRGCVCPECDTMIQISGDLKWRCTCKEWNYDS